MKMNIYRATFYGSNGDTFKTLIQAEDFKSAKKEVEDNLINGGHFEIEGKGNRYFVVMQSNLVFVEYELLLNDNKMGFKNLINLPTEELQHVLNQIPSLKVLAVAMVGLTPAEKEVVYQGLSKEEKTSLQTEINELWEVSLPEVYSAQELITSMALNLNKEGSLSI